MADDLGGLPHVELDHRVGEAELEADDGLEERGTKFRQRFDAMPDIRRAEEPRVPVDRADERRAAAVDDVDRARCYSAAVARDGGCDEIPPCEDCADLDTKASPRARCAPLPLVGRGWGWG